MQIFIVAPAMPDSIFLLWRSRKIFPDDSALSETSQPRMSLKIFSMISFVNDWIDFTLNIRDFWGFPDQKSLSWQLLEYSMKSGKFSALPHPNILNIQRFISFWRQKTTFHVLNFSGKWPIFPITDYRVPRVLRELINNVTLSRKHFYLHLSLQPPWHITICSTKAEFSASSFESNRVWSVLFGNRILYTWRHVLRVS